MVFLVISKKSQQAVDSLLVITPCFIDEGQTEYCIDIKFDIQRFMVVFLSLFKIFHLTVGVSDPCKNYLVVGVDGEDSFPVFET